MGSRETKRKNLTYMVGSQLFYPIPSHHLQAIQTIYFPFQSLLTSKVALSHQMNFFKWTIEIYMLLTKIKPLFLSMKQKP